MVTAILNVFLKNVHPTRLCEYPYPLLLKLAIVMELLPLRTLYRFVLSKLRGMTIAKLILRIVNSLPVASKVPG